MNENERVEALIDIILDPNAEDHEKIDVGMDLVLYDDDRAIEALINVSCNPKENDFPALEFYGETIGEYWVRRNYFSLDIYLKLRGSVQNAIYYTIKASKPEWIKKYKLDEIELNKD